MLKHFNVSDERTRLVVPVEFYQMNLIRAVERARRLDPDLFTDGDDVLPSWAKFARDPIRAKSLWTQILSAMFLGQGNLDELNIDLQTRDVNDRPQVSMMFLSGGMTNKNLKQVVKFTEEALPGWRVLEISGAGVHGGQKITNRNAERITREVIADSARTRTPLLILSRGMAQRSYSIGELNHIFLCYDQGDAGATNQKTSRGLTPYTLDKVGRIFSLSFDSNRDDKFDTMLLLTAKNIVKRKKVELDQAIMQVIGTVDLFACTANGKTKIDPAEYMAQMLERDSLSRVVSIRAPLIQAPTDLLIAIVNGESDYARMDKTKAADRGKCDRPCREPNGKKSGVGIRELLIAQARKVIAALVERLPFICMTAGLDNVRDSLLQCKSDTELADFVVELVGLSPDMILYLFDNGWIDYHLASLQRSVITTIKRR